MAERGPRKQRCMGQLTGLRCFAINCVGATARLQLLCCEMKPLDMEKEPSKDLALNVGLLDKGHLERGHDIAAQGQTASLKELYVPSLEVGCILSAQTVSHITLYLRARTWPPSGGSCCFTRVVP